MSSEEDSHTEDKKSDEVEDSLYEESSCLSHTRSYDRTDDEKYYEDDCRESTYSRRSELRSRDLSTDKGILPDHIETIRETYTDHRKIEKYRRNLWEDSRRKKKYNTENQCDEEHLFF